MPYDSATAQAVRFAIGVVSDSGKLARTLRSDFGIPAASASVVTPVQDAVVCDAVTAAVDAGSTTPRVNSLITVRIGTNPTFYIATGSTTGVLGVLHLLDANYTLLAGIGSQ